MHAAEAHQDIKQEVVEKNNVISTTPIVPAAKIPAHVFRVAVRAGLLGFGIRAGIVFLLRLLRVFKGKASLLTTLKNTLTSPDVRQFTYFFASFAGIWKLVNDILRLKRGVDDKLNGFVAGACAGLALGFEDKGKRVAIAQQILVRGLQCVFNSLKAREIFHIPYGSTLIFSLASAQIMYAYALHPTTIPRAFYKFIQSTGPIPERVLQFVRDSNNGIPIKKEDVVDVVRKYQGTTKAFEEVGNMDDVMLGSVIPCSVLHPWYDGCWRNAGWVFAKVFKKIIPVYLTLTLVPMTLLHLPQLLKSPLSLLRKTLLNAFRSTIFLSTFVSSYQALICLHRHLISPSTSDTPLIYHLTGLLSSLSILLEHPRRRTELAMYVLPRGVDSLYRLLRHKSLAPRIKYFEVGMFSVGMGFIIAFFQTEPDAMGGMMYRLLRRVNMVIEDRDQVVKDGLVKKEKKDEAGKEVEASEN